MHGRMLRLSEKRHSLTRSLAHCPCRCSIAVLQEAILSLDAKNYHVWAYRSVQCKQRRSLCGQSQPPTDLVGCSVARSRAVLRCACLLADSQWLVARFSLWSTELPFVDSLLDADVRNNSAWNHRYFVHDKRQAWNESTVRSEVESAATPHRNTQHEPLFHRHSHTHTHTCTAVAVQVAGTLAYPPLRATVCPCLAMRSAASLLRSTMRAHGTTLEGNSPASNHRPQQRARLGGRKGRRQRAAVTSSTTHTPFSRSPFLPSAVRVACDTGVRTDCLCCRAVRRPPSSTSSGWRSM